MRPPPCGSDTRPRAPPLLLIPSSLSLSSPVSLSIPNYLDELHG
jgi:hypothetical protein